MGEQIYRPSEESIKKVIEILVDAAIDLIRKERVEKNG